MGRGLALMPFLALPACAPRLVDRDTSRIHADTATAGDTSAPGDTAGTGDTAPPPVDADGDGYPSTVDCDDADPSIHPDAFDTCLDTVDADCDGAVDEACDVTDATAVETTGIEGGAAVVGDLDGDGLDEILVLQIGNHDDDYYDDVGEVDILSPATMSAWTGDASTDAMARIVGSGDDANLGWYGAFGLGDLDGDGRPDFGVAALIQPADTLTPDDHLYIFSSADVLSSPGDVPTSAATTTFVASYDADGEWTVPTSAARYGGTDDVVAIAGLEEVDLLPAGTTTGAGELDPTAADDSIFLQRVPGKYSTPMLVSTDADGDGNDDVVIAHGMNFFYGPVYIFTSRPSGRVLAEDADAVWSAPTSDEPLHAGVVGDVNGDGIADLAAGDFTEPLPAPHRHWTGVLHIMDSPELLDGAHLTSEAPDEIDGQRSESDMGLEAIAWDGVDGPSVLAGVLASDGSGRACSYLDADLKGVVGAESADRCFVDESHGARALTWLVTGNLDGTGSDVGMVQGMHCGSAYDGSCLYLFDWDGSD